MYLVQDNGVISKDRYNDESTWKQFTLFWTALPDGPCLAYLDFCAKKIPNGEVVDLVYLYPNQGYQTGQWIWKNIIPTLTYRLLLPTLFLPRNRQSRSYNYQIQPIKHLDGERDINKNSFCSILLTEFSGRCTNNEQVQEQTRRPMGRPTNKV